MDSELPSSQIDEDQLRELEKNDEQGGTVNTTSWTMKRWDDWLEKRESKIDNSSVPPESLSDTCSDFTRN